MFDLAASAVLLALLAVPMFLIALLVKLEDGQAVFYLQERIGVRGRAFLLTKFRSMVVGAEFRGAGVRVEQNDTRITRIGRILRKLSLDELPQLFNVLKGEMSLVGPRPGLRFQAELYDKNQLGRLSVRPGITGWAQVNGRNAIRWPQRILLDLEYVAHISPWLDLQILFRTIPVLLSGSGQIADVDYWKQRREELERGTGAGEGTTAGAEGRVQQDRRMQPPLT